MSVGRLTSTRRGLARSPTFQILPREQVVTDGFSAASPRAWAIGNVLPVSRRTSNA